ncbi:MAG: DUF1501 domain-containing protein [Planctomycetes bacterium]|nr:DUF1501 domain-containing protein [Planctomycetota bacterium]
MAKPHQLGLKNRPLTRRSFFHHVGAGLYGTALACLLERDLYGGPGLLATEPSGPSRVYDLAPRPPHFAPKARSVIHLFMNGGPSQMDLFDPKPELERHHGQPYFDKIAGEVEFPDAAGALFRSPFKFAQHGQCGMWVSDAMPHLAKCVDDIAIIRSMYTENLTHELALFQVHSGRTLPGLAALGAWVTYGLGSENQNLPAYVVLDDPLGLPVNRTQNWQAGFLPPVYQGTRFRSTGLPVLNLKRDFDEPDEVTLLERELVSALDRIHRASRLGQPQLDARIASYELAARMQLAATDAADLSQESKGTLAMYGIGDPKTDSYGRRCLIARRLVERGVRFVQLFIDHQIWDNHNEIGQTLREACERTDLPIAGLLRDLKQRGLFDCVLVVWGGEMGRLPLAQLPADKDESKAGRDHNKNAVCTWLAGAGIRGGTTWGTTDELGFAAVENQVSVADWHATILHLLGLHHEELFFERNGLKERLTGVLQPQVVSGILA